MKKLISAETIEAWHKNGQTRIEVNVPQTIITAEAYHRAQQLGLELVEVQSASQNLSHTDKLRIVEQVQKKVASGKYSRAKIEQALKAVLAAEK